MSKMAIKISSNGTFSKCVVPLRKYTCLGIAEIKNKIENKDFFAETDANDIDDMENLKGLVDNLLKLGAEVRIFDSDEYGEGIFDYQEISYDQFINNIDRLKEIMEELQDDDDAMSDEV
ncbi:hypothetical protein H1Z61_17365 [Bacillus aquiflavi]|uniref:Uncharacterized protein n=1 Tax=Bacillus aquiflavi TaxID=2672567 RepID=A0A6B3W634_9BACI|nr:hypothetical protein [Bacillus aquiflavi]MBA4538842.1 hypothetical protein [Bacillus aquiflavi]NEY83201.1 hypothetical protein [Bacillus aquiflavi]